MDEQVAHDLTSNSDRKGDGSPLYLIREKEMEIAGRVLAAKKQAEEIISDARKKAAGVVSDAEAEGQELAKAREAELFAETDRQIDEMRSASERERQELLSSIADRRDKAVDRLMELIQP